MRDHLWLLSGFLLCIVLAAVGEWLGQTSALPLPGGVIGFFILLSVFVLCPALQPRIERGAELLLDNLLLLFIPAVMAIIAYPEFVGILGIKLLIILITGTALMMACVGLFAQWMLKCSAFREDER